MTTPIEHFWPPEDLIATFPDRFGHLKPSMAAEQAPSPHRGSLYAAVETVTGGCKVFHLHATQRRPVRR